MIFIGITGYKQCGKDTVAKLLMQQLGEYRCCHINFADALKQEICRALCITRPYLDEHKANFRLIMQGWGTDYRRKLCGDTYWVQKWLETIRDMKQTPEFIIATDVRFLNEAEAIRELGGMIVRVHRQSCSCDGHESERELDSISPDLTLGNHHTLADLLPHVVDLSKQIKERYRWHTNSTTH